MILKIDRERLKSESKIILNFMGENHYTDTKWSLL
jgi:hypothetical protein